MDATVGLSLGICFGFVLGIFASLIAGVWMARIQFKASTAKYRVDMVTNATRDIFAQRTSYLGPLRDKYRYSLGVVVEALVKGFGSEGWREDGPWPLLFPAPDENATDKSCETDRWDYFDRYVRPVLTDINVYSFLARVGHPSKVLRFRPDLPLRELDCLTELCHRLEDVVGELDAACEATKIQVFTQNGEKVISRKDNADIATLRKAYYCLYQVWCKWLDVVGAN